MPEAVVFALRAVVLVLLWGFVVATVVAVRHDVFGTRASRITPPAGKAAPKPAEAKPAKPAKPAAAAKASRRTQDPARVATRLTVVDGPFTGTSAALSSLPISIGRAANSGIVLNDDYVSNTHAQLVPRGAEWLITDTGSTNGTFVGDHKVTTPLVVPVGGRITIGRNVLELQA